MKYSQVRIRIEDKEVLKRRAEQERRSMTNMLSVLINDGKEPQPIIKPLPNQTTVEEALSNE